MEFSGIGKVVRKNKKGYIIILCLSFSLWEEHKESALLIPVKLYLMYEKEDCIIHGIFSLLYRYETSSTDLKDHSKVTKVLR